MSRPIRVLHVLPWVTSGGVERRRLTLARGLDPEEFEQRIVCLEARGPLRSQIERHGVSVSPIGGSWTIWDARSVATTASLIREFAPDIVHGGVFEGVSLASLASLVARKGRLVVEEIAYPVDRSWRGRALFRALCLRAVRCVAVSPAVGEYLRDYAGISERKLRIIPNGVEVPEEPDADTIAALRARLGLPKDALVVGSVGRMHDHQKRFSDLLRVVAALKNEFPAVRVVLVGDGPDRFMLESLATELGLRERVIFAGFQADVTPFYRLMDVFALLSRNESFGLAVVEAMLSEVPTLCTRVGGMRDIVIDGGTGSLVDVGDVRQIASALMQLLRDRKLRRAWGSAGRKRAIDHFSATRYLANVRELYRELGAADG